MKLYIKEFWQQTNSPLQINRFYTTEGEEIYVIKNIDENKYFSTYGWITNFILATFYKDYGLVKKVMSEINHETIH